MYCVYKHTCPNGKVYIGKTCRKPEVRWGYNGERYCTSPHFWNAIQKYGWDNIKHEILFSKLTAEEASKKEIEMIAFYNSTNRLYGYNITSGGDGSLGVSHTYEWKKEHSKRMSCKNNPFYGKHHTDEKKEYWSNIRRGKNIGGDNPNAKRVEQINVDTNCVVNIFDSIADANRHMGKKPNSTNIVACCNGKSKTAYGFKWRYSA